MALSVEQFVQQLTSLGIVTATDLQPCLDDVVARQSRDATELGRMLVQQNRLTLYQLDRIMDGQAKDLVLGNYIVLDHLGRGGMGVLLKARHRRMERIVALKVLSPSVTRVPNSLERFLREVKAAARLEHPNIVTAYDADEANDLHFLVMQFIDGMDLSKLVRRQGALAPERACQYVLQAARGLEYAHGRGVIHRDIKPSNLLLDHNGAIRILDMGLARIDSEVQQDTLTSSGQIMGTVDYMSPEQAMDSKSADARSDIYALGITLWYLMTSRVVYDGDTALSKIWAHRNNPVPSLRRAVRQISMELDAVFKKMIAKRMSDRCQTMTEVIADLQNCPEASRPIATTDPLIETAPISRSGSSNPVVSSSAATLQKSPITSLASGCNEDVTVISTIDDTSPIPQDVTLLKPLRQRVTWWQLLIGAAILSALLAAAVIFVQSRRH